MLQMKKFSSPSRSAGQSNSKTLAPREEMSGGGEIRLLHWRRVLHGPIRGVAAVEWGGLNIFEITIGGSNGRYWAKLPSRRLAVTGPDKHATLIEWATPELADDFCRRLVGLIRARDSAAFSV